MKRLLLFLYIFVICITFNSCNFIAGGGYFNQTTYNCDWHEDKNAYFYNADLNTPEECDNIFRNELLETFLDRNSIFELMQQIQYVSFGVSSFSFKWTVTVKPNKMCTSQNDQFKSIILTQDDYTNKFSSNNDLLSGTPYISESNYIYATDYKHEMVFQIFELENTYNGKIGTMTWKYTWDTFIENNGELNFIFPNGGIMGTFSPNAYQSSPKLIYMDGQYVEI